MENFSDLIRNRRSMRKFTDEELTQDHERAAAIQHDLTLLFRAAGIAQPANVLPGLSWLHRQELKNE